MTLTKETKKEIKKELKQLINKYEDVNHPKVKRYIEEVNLFPQYHMASWYSGMYRK